MNRFILSLACAAASLLGFGVTGARAATIPIAATDIAARWDSLYDFLVWLSIFFFILVVGAMVYFAIQYRHRAGVKPKYMTGHHLLEAIWIAVPTVLLMVIFGWGFSVYHNLIHAPSDAMEIRVIGKQWLWTFQYDNGKSTVADLYVPINRPVKLLMTSQDVTHAFFVPNFRVKSDVVPGMYTSVWFEARVPGKHQIFCTQYCGTSHSLMIGKVIALDDAQWKAWNEGKKLGEIPDARDVLNGTEVAQNAADRVTSSQAAVSLQPTGTLAEQGRHVFESKGCVACHSVDGTSKIGPSQKGLFGRKEALSDGTVVMADENYIRESIELPQAKLVKGYTGVMPTFKGMIDESEMNSLIAYIKSLK